MTVKIGVKMSGQRDIEANLKILREHYGVRTGGVILRSLQVGANIIRDEAQRVAPKLESELARKKFAFRRFHRAGHRLEKRAQGRVPLNLKSNIVAHKVSARKNGGTPGVWVRVRTKSGYIHDFTGNYLANLVNNPIYWWLLEFGTSKIPAKRFLSESFLRKKDEASRAIFQHAKKEIDSLFAKFTRRAA